MTSGDGFGVIKNLVDAHLGSKPVWRINFAILALRRCDWLTWTALNLLQAARTEIDPEMSGIINAV